MAKGRPSLYKPAYNKLAEKYCKLGLIDREIADLFDVSEKTLNTWKKQHPDFLQSLKRGKSVADAEVANSLFKRATGFTHPDSQIFYDSKAGKSITVKTVKHYAPDTTAAIFWLKNRQPNKWRDKQEVENSIKGDVEVTLNLD